MIVEWFLQVVATVWGWICAALPDVPVPAWLTDTSSWFAVVWQSASSMGAWVPLGLGTTVVAAVMACLVAGFAIKVARIVFSFMTAGGGSAG